MIRLCAYGLAADDLTLLLRMDTDVGPEQCAFRLSESYPDLTATITPSEFKGYPNINYHPAIATTAARDATPD
jgi:hypothetical protein